MTTDDDSDPKALIFEAYRIDMITPAECRSIFLDWALSLPADADTAAAVERLLARYGADNTDHPMTSVLRAGMTRLSAPRRRGGWRARPRN